MDTISRASAAPSLGVFTDWAIKSSFNYGFTIVLLFVLGLLGRFLGAVKAQLERKWSATRSNIYRRHQQHGSLQEDESEESQPLKPETLSDEVTPSLPTKAFWTADEVWDGKRDGIRAVLEFSRAVIAYTL